MRIYTSCLMHFSKLSGTLQVQGQSKQNVFNPIFAFYYLYYELAQKPCVARGKKRENFEELFFKITILKKNRFVSL